MGMRRVDDVTVWQKRLHHPFVISYRGRNVKKRRISRVLDRGVTVLIYAFGSEEMMIRSQLTSALISKTKLNMRI